MLRVVRRRLLFLVKLAFSITLLRIPALTHVRHFTAHQLDEYLSDDFLFPMTSRLSYASSPESDLDLSPEPRPATGALNASSSSKNGGLNASAASGKSPSTEGRLIKSSSDPSIATQDDLGMGTGHSSPPPKFLQPLPVNAHLSNGVSFLCNIYFINYLN